MTFKWSIMNLLSETFEFEVDESSVNKHLDSAQVIEHIGSQLFLFDISDQGVLDRLPEMSLSDVLSSLNVVRLANRDSMVELLDEVHDTFIQQVVVHVVVGGRRWDDLVLINRR